MHRSKQKKKIYFANFIRILGVSRNRSNQQKLYESLQSPGFYSREASIPILFEWSRRVSSKIESSTDVGAMQRRGGGRIYSQNRSRLVCGEYKLATLKFLIFIRARESSVRIFSKK